MILVQFEQRHPPQSVTRAHPSLQVDMVVLQQYALLDNLLDPVYTQTWTVASE